MNRLSREERIAGIASLVLVISLFLPWLSGKVTESGAGVPTTTVNYGSISGYSLHGYFWIVFILCLAVIAFLVAKAGFATMPVDLPLSADQILLGATAISFIIVLLGFLFTGYGFANENVNTGLYHYHAGTSRAWGAYLSLIAAIVATAPFAWPFIQKRTNKS